MYLDIGKKAEFSSEKSIFELSKIIRTEIHFGHFGPDPIYFGPNPNIF